VSGQVELIYSDRYNSKEIKRNISTTEYFSVSGNPPIGHKTLEKNTQTFYCFSTFSDFQSASAK
jgi:hypothetical protein